MRKCARCNTEFEGDVCPVCGTIATEEEQKPIENNTIQQDETEQEHVPQSAPDDRKNSLKGLLFYYANFLPSFFFLAFTALFTLFNITPVAISPIKSYNVFSLAGAGFPASGCCIFLIVLWILCVAASGVIIYLLIAKRYDRLNFTETEISYHTIAGTLSSPLLLIVLVAACVAAGMISDKVTSVGSAPVLIIIFSALFLVLIVCTAFLKPLAANKYPSLLEDETKYYQKSVDLQREKQMKKLSRDEEKKRIISEYIESHPCPAAVQKPDKKLYLLKLNKSENEFFNKAKRGQNLKKQVCFSAFMLLVNVCLWVVISIIAYVEVKQTSAFNGVIFLAICAVVAAVSVLVTIFINKLIGCSRPNKLKKCCSMRPLKFFNVVTLIMAIVCIGFAAGGIALFVNFAGTLGDSVRLQYQIALIVSVSLFGLAFILCLVLLVNSLSARRHIRKIRVLAYGSADTEDADPVKSYEQLFPEYAEYLQKTEEYENYQAECKAREKAFRLFLRSVK